VLASAAASVGVDAANERLDEANAVAVGVGVGGGHDHARARERGDCARCRCHFHFHWRCKCAHFGWQSRGATVVAAGDAGLHFGGTYAAKRMKSQRHMCQEGWMTRESETEEESHSGNAVVVVAG
jgi:hypothetical protein